MPRTNDWRLLAAKRDHRLQVYPRTNERAILSAACPMRWQAQMEDTNLPRETQYDYDGRDL